MLTTEDKRELNERGRKAGLGLDLWPEVKEGDAFWWSTPWGNEPLRAYVASLQGDPGPYTPLGIREMTPGEKRASLESQWRGMPGWGPYLGPGPPPVVYVNEFDLNETAEEWVEKWIPRSNWTRLKNLLRRMSPWHR